MIETIFIFLYCIHNNKPLIWRSNEKMYLKRVWDGGNQTMAVSQMDHGGRGGNYSISRRAGIRQLSRICWYSKGYRKL